MSTAGDETTGAFDRSLITAPPPATPPRRPRLVAAPRAAGVSSSPPRRLRSRRISRGCTAESARGSTLPASPPSINAPRGHRRSLLHPHALRQCQRRSGRQCLRGQRQRQRRAPYGRASGHDGHYGGRHGGRILQGCTGCTRGGGGGGRRRGRAGRAAPARRNSTSDGVVRGALAVVCAGGGAVPLRGGWAYAVHAWLDGPRKAAAREEGGGGTLCRRERVLLRASRCSC